MDLERLAELVHRTRTEQGLSPVVTDRAVLDYIANLLAMSDGDDRCRGDGKPR